MNRSRWAARPSVCGSGCSRPNKPTDPIRRKRASSPGTSCGKSADSERRLIFRELELITDPLAQPLHISTRPSMTFHGNIQVAVSESRSIVENGGRVVFFAPSNGELERLSDIFSGVQDSFPARNRYQRDDRALSGRARLSGGLGREHVSGKGWVARGVTFTDSQLTMFGSEDLFDTSALIAQPASTRSAAAAFQPDIADLKPGDYVVHTQHGVGRFLGIRTIAQGEQAGDFMVLEYSNEAKLYVPLTRMDLVQKFRGAGEAAPPLDRLGGATWNKTKSRVKAKMRDMADELLKLYAERKMAEGFSFSPDSNWQREFEDAFEYTPTKDQLQAVRQIKRDMESEQPMDRLLCGDVGFGKTEVAMRAAFKALGDGKQVAILAPTTVLALQHFESFKRRFAPFPVRVEMLSRFRSPKEIKRRSRRSRRARSILSSAHTGCFRKTSHLPRSGAAGH